jgi:hypothetical protein
MLNSSNKNKNKACLPFVLALFASPAFAQRPLPASPITQATLDDHRKHDARSPLCTRDEITLWTCENKKRVFSLCSSPTASRTTGYLQYRAATGGKVTFAYPAVKAPPLGLFKYDIFGNGDASIAFTNNGYAYNLADVLRGHSAIYIAAPGVSGKETRIACGPNQSLQLDDTMRLMSEFGLWTRD